MGVRTWISIAACFTIAACGGSGESTNESSKSSFEQGFDKGFHENFVSSCVKSATGAGAPQDKADKLCNCASDKIKANFSTREKMSLSQDKVFPLVEQCRAEVGE